MKKLKQLRWSRHSISQHQEDGGEEEKHVKRRTKWYYLVDKQDGERVRIEDDERDWKGRTILYQQVANDDVENVTILLQQGCNVNVPDFLKTTPLLLSVSQNNVELTQLLIQAGANVNAANCQGRTPLMVSAKRRNVKLAKLLIDAKADVNAADEDGWTPLHECAKRGDEESLKLFLNADADVNAKDWYGRTPLHFSARFGHKQITKHLINRGAFVNTTGFQGRTALHESSMAGHTDVVSQLLFQEASVDVQDVNLWTPLHESSASGHYDIVKSLLLFGANVVSRNKDGETPLMLATQKKHTNIERILRQKQAYVEGTIQGPMILIDRQTESERNSSHVPYYESPNPIFDSPDAAPQNQRDSHSDEKQCASQAIPPKLPPKLSSTRSTSETSACTSKTRQLSEELYSDSSNCYNEIYDVPPSKSKYSPNSDEEDCTTQEALPPLPPRVTLKRPCDTFESSANAASTSLLSEEKNTSNEPPCPIILDTADAATQEQTDNHPDDEQTIPQAVPPKPRPRSTSTRQSYTGEPFYVNVCTRRASEEGNSSNDPEYLCPTLDIRDAASQEQTNNHSDEKQITTKTVPPTPRPRSTSTIRRSTNEPSAYTAGMSQSLEERNLSIDPDNRSRPKQNPPDAAPEQQTDNNQDAKQTIPQTDPPTPRPRKTSTSHRSTSEPSAYTAEKSQVLESLESHSSHDCLGELPQREYESHSSHDCLNELPQRKYEYPTLTKPDAVPSQKDQSH